MRYGKAEQLVRLCLMMAERADGVTLEAIAERFEVSRRTAERMRDAAMRLLPEVTEWTDMDGRKHWKAAGLPAALTAVTAGELAELAGAAALLRAHGRPASADALDTLASKLQARLGRAAQRRTESDLELLMESEGVACRPGPRVSVDRARLETVREAILASLRLSGRYLSRLKGGGREVVLEPHGLLYGTRPFLVAREAGRAELRHYRLQGFADLSLTEHPFERIEGFDIAEYARALFGTFQEPAFDVAWRFRPSAAADAAGYLFHPDQSVEHCADGALIVRFRAGGALEMAWHLATWGDAVEVLEPPDFWDRVGESRGRLVEIAGRNGGAAQPG